MPLTVEVVDLTHGRPASDVRVGLECSDGSVWTAVASASTDESGRIDDWGGADGHDRDLRLVIDARRYFAAQGLLSSQADITIAVGPTSPWTVRHVPVLLAPFGYSTYTGLSS
ncbi:hydroxyisourate hydrolase [Pseudonocardia abyssalis]|uniref:Hydroxyisourate hydrolase n=1 Tax=Pseudonocardia abyssalis TaxID=2792008 RepID=A0ABS6UM75_9PSEU|nr:hydroxyisourate hydrolase [Pseudonocardia abyssalis]MBW0116211.1 hydroxyisourate hydrolase [Pseudonocardia abyssalis]MBW0133336.1 hydroxyisourate hydrolase [Pseudonocardia abyssalis]